MPAEAMSHTRCRPKRTYRREQPDPFAVVLGDEEVERAGAEVESIEHDVGAERDRG